MRKFLVVAIMLAIGAQVSGGTARSQAILLGSGPTICPTNYICSLIATSTAPLVGLANDGEPLSVIGFLNFDGTGGITGVVSLNRNGTTTVNHALTGATCVSGTATTLGTITIPITTSAGTRTLVFDFVTYVTSVSIDLLMSNETSTTPADTHVGVGVCRASFAG